MCLEESNLQEKLFLLLYLSILSGLDSFYLASFLLAHPQAGVVVRCPYLFQFPHSQTCPEEI